MDCKTMREQMSFYIDDMLGESEKEEFLKHMAECKSCSHELDQLAEMVSILRDIPELTVPDQFDVSFREALKRSKEVVTADTAADNASSEGDNVTEMTAIKKKWKNRYKVVASLAAAFVVGFVSLSMYNNGMGILPEEKYSLKEGAGILNDEVRSSVPSDMDNASVEPESSEQSDDQSVEYKAAGENLPPDVIMKGQDAGNANNGRSSGNSAAGSGTGGESPLQSLQTPLLVLPDGAASDLSRSMPFNSSMLPQEEVLFDEDEVWDDGAVDNAEESMDGGSGSSGSGGGGSSQSSDKEKFKTVYTEAYYTAEIEKFLSGKTFTVQKNEIDSATGDYLFTVIIQKDESGETVNSTIYLVGSEGVIYEQKDRGN